MENLERIVQSAAAMGAAQVLETLGITAGEISQRQARKTYGKWFTVAAIQELRCADLVRAELQLKNKTL